MVAAPRPNHAAEAVLATDPGRPGTPAMKPEQ
jgi:hypothetical protein